MPRLESGMVLVKVSKCGICGSDIRYYHGENPWAKQTLQQEVPNPPNIILGHELTGTVVERVSRRGSQSDRQACWRSIASSLAAAVIFAASAWKTSAGRPIHLGHGQGWGKRDFYPGGMAEYCPAFASQVYELSDRVTDEQATFCDPIIAALHAVDVAGPELLDFTAIQGAGPIGLLIAQLAKRHGSNAWRSPTLQRQTWPLPKPPAQTMSLNVAEGGAQPVRSGYAS